MNWLSSCLIILS